MPAVENGPGLTTALHGLHLELGAKMVPFAGYDMPVQYPLGILKEHLHTREAAGLFDVSHMGQLRLTGENVAAQLEQLIPVDIATLGINRQVYGTFLNELGGILDDLIICRWGEQEYFLVVNAACKEQDIAHLRKNLQDVEVDVLGGRALLALQGPKAVDVLCEFCPELGDLVFMSGRAVELMGVSCYVTRSGYTGEDGFEISVPAAQADSLARAMLSSDLVEPIGLGARDTLRLEAGLCLYGHDMNTETSPVEAAIAWSISKARRPDGARAGGFPGARQIFSQMRDGVSRKRVGFVVEGRAPVREGADIQDAQGNTVGQVTSGGYAPSLEAPVGMAYVPMALSALDTPLFASVRGRLIPIKVTRMPLVPQRYFRG
jgi:glycine cleavage system T protein (aminomethyltransferase)